MKSQAAFLLAFLGFLAIGLSNREVEAGLLHFDSDVTVAADSSLDGIPLLNDTPVHFQGVFDNNVLNVQLFAAFYPFQSLAIDIEGLGHYTAKIPGNFGVLALRPSLLGGPAIGLSDVGVSGGYYTRYTTTVQPYVFNSLLPNIFIDAVFSGTSELTIPLSGGDGDFIFEITIDDPTFASLVQAPAPGSCVLFGVGMLLLAIGHRRARSAL
ncbi:MAG: hypothetical protein ACKV0T_13195 [Planctomycetales bacterium]